jgi:hypothetical protein
MVVNWMGCEAVLRLLDEREAAYLAELGQLEVGAARIAELMTRCRRELERVATAREVVGDLPLAHPAAADAAGVVGVGVDAQVFAERVLAVLAERGGPVRCREVVAALGEDPRAAREVERVRHRLKKLVAAGLVGQTPAGLFTLTGEGGASIG